MCFWRKPWNTPFAHRLRFEKTEVHPVKDLVGVSAGDNPWFVGVVRHGLVADAAIGDEVGAWLDRSGVEAMQRLRRPVENPFQPNPPGVPVLRELDSPNRSDFPGRIRFLGRAHGGALGRAPGGVCLAPEGHPPVSSTSTICCSRLRSGSTIARRSLCSKSQAALVLPMPT